MTIRRTRFHVAAMSAGVLLIAAAGAATAASHTERDPRGDGSQRGLDILTSQITNGPRAITGRVRFVELSKGDVVISLEPRDDRDGVRIVGYFDPHGPERSFVLPGDFSSRSVAAGGGRVKCPGLRIDWHPGHSDAEFSLPASCLDGGKYADVRYTVLSEASGGDVDIAPDGDGRHSPHSPWIHRG